MDHAQLLSDATRALQDAHIATHAAKEALTEAQRNLAAAEAHHTLAGLEGKNAEARKAELGAKTTSEQHTVETAERSHREAALSLTLAELDYKLAREALSLHRAELLARAPIAAD